MEDVQNNVSIFIDPHDLNQVLMNLIINAMHSMKTGGILSVTAKRNNGKVILEMSDTGEGIDKKDIHNIFDPFYTTKKPGDGTGLGLWVTYEIVKSYNGDISVESKKGEGSKFTLQFNHT